MRSGHISTVNVSGQPLRVALWPGTVASPALLVCNGIGASLEMVQPAIERLDGIGAIAFDVPGNGGSPPAREPLRMRGLARLVGGLLDQLRQPVVDVLGVSWGGFLAQELAHRFPTRVRKLILAATGAGGAAVPGRLWALASLANPRRYYDLDYLVRVAPEVYGGAFRKHPELARKYFKVSKAPNPRGYYGQMFAMLGWQSILWLHRLEQPTLVLAGKDDPLCPLINARILTARIPRARLHIVDDGHLFLLTSADQVAPVIRRFLLEL